MSVVVGIKKDGVFYLGADTQITSGNLIMRGTDKEGYKIKDMGNGLLCCAVGNCDITGNICMHDELFVLPKDGLTKRFVVKEFAPKVLQIIKDEKLVDEIKEGSPDIECGLVLVYKDKCIMLRSDLTVWEVDDALAIGSGKSAAYASLTMSNKTDVREKLIDALNAASDLITSVSAPYVLIDSKNLEYEIIGG